jgi:hypothetical protein
MAHIKGRCNPAYKIVVRLGGCTKTAKIVGVLPSTVSRWLVHDGTNGRIPQEYWPDILRHTSRRGIKISVNDLAGIDVK